MKPELNDAVVCIVGLGYVGLPLAEAFSTVLNVIGFDNDIFKIERLNTKFHGCGIPLSDARITFTADPGRISEANFIIICVPTPVTRSKEPDLSYIEDAARTIGHNMKSGTVVILESTVFPGATEEIVKPILEQESGLRCGSDFRIGYSPERINPGDELHTVKKTTKVVAGMDTDTTELIAELYLKVAPDVFRAKDIRTAEAAKVIENIQRDLNIALINELAIIFEKMGLKTKDVLDAATTKWNFHRYSPGLVGGHCIPVDPYYLVYKAKELDYHPQVILAGRAINDYMPKHVAEMTIKALNNVGKASKGSRVLILGLTYKENVADTRESPLKSMVKELVGYGVEVIGFDPLLDVDDIGREFNIKSYRNFGEIKTKSVDAIIITVAHTAFHKLSLRNLRETQNDSPILVDIPGIFDAAAAQEMGFYYKTL